MIIESKGIIKDNFFIPPFELSEGEIIILHLFGGGHYNQLKEYLKSVFTEKLKNESITIHKPLKFVDYITEPKWRSLFYPITVGEYLQKNANFDSEYATKIYETNTWITKKTRIDTLAGTPRKLLSLFAQLSNSNNILFDLDGQDPLGATDMYEFVKENVKNGGSGILLDWTDELRNDCTKFIQLEQVK